MARIFVSGAVSMIITEQRAPAFRAANATPCAAFPSRTAASGMWRRETVVDNPCDGSRLRLRPSMLGLSSEQFADAIDRNGLGRTEARRYCRRLEERVVNGFL